MKNTVGRDIPQEYAEKYGVFEGQYAKKTSYQRASGKVTPVHPGESKLVGSIREAIEKCGLKDGMTISFHHHFREGDYVLNMVMDEIAKMGIKNLYLAPSSIANVHEPLIEHIKNGVVTGITSSGLRDKVGLAISQGIMKNPVIIRSHGGRARAIETGALHIDVAFLGVPSADEYGNANGSHGNAICGSLGYAKVDAEYADKVVLITDNLVPYPNTPISIPQNLVDYVVKVDAIGDPNGIAKGATRFTSNPKELLIAEIGSKVIVNSPYFKNGFSFQSGSGGSTLAVARFLAEEMRERGIKAGFILGGITSNMVEMLEEGLAEKIIDTQSFDRGAAESLARNENHYEISASFYANPGNKGAAVNNLDVVVLSALEVDTDFNVNVLTGSDGAIRGASGGHCDTAAGAKLSMILTPLVRGRIPTIVEKVNTVITPGEGIDVVVTEIGIAINPRRQDLIDALKDSGIPQFTIEELKEKAYKIAGTPDPIEYEDQVVALVEYRDGSIIDVVRKIKE
ncbi:citrate lyase subunit alpha [Lutispora thermophila]|uniref:Citrate lyase alpha chain n=1 Tax=Lutispora thermophila DSM 19022 TaxID=1122184 RepID=A0A1M6IDC2_9FIRM|nr:citrate lyase subunit alpha [Lutispora thermophila]SHJ32462.1 citrate lyase subunit alpha / citrate CoA-transferase [Lutispora thermophila DSM 19022]